MSDNCSEISVRDSSNDKDCSDQTENNDDLVENLIASVDRADDANGIDEEILAVLNNPISEDDFGPTLADDIASSINKINELEFNKDLISRLKTENKTPNNCKYLQAPKVNPQLWNVLPLTTRSSDVALQSIQQSTARAMTAASKVLELLMKNSNTIPKSLLHTLMKQQMDAVYCQAIAHKEISARRRVMIKPVLSKEFASICNKSSYGTEFLFGDSLEQDLKSAQSSSRIIRSGVNSNPNRGRYSPYTAQRGRGNHSSLNSRRPSNRFRGGGLLTYRGRNNKLMPHTPNSYGHQ